ncbi:hypothetical protein Glove_360g50 [Diversispora epigaea]|uniref:Uncharacterized protein n=1 Tax=Diversispora epigaea TaxID=1348612 RepID=A0A397HA88_9GLOM|nr:hypothetical protein Glove_360g50 [Diversispora epigaea]
MHWVMVQIVRVMSRSTFFQPSNNTKATTTNVITDYFPKTKFSTTPLSDLNLPDAKFAKYEVIW